MNLAIDPHSSVPPYEQIRSQVADAVGSGALLAGTRLPTVRRLAQDLGLAPNTVARAYRALEQACVVQTRGRLGTFVDVAGEAFERAAFDAAQDYVRRTDELGLDDDDAVRWVRDALRADRELVRAESPVKPRPRRG